jgi:hypothetical protein
MRNTVLLATLAMGCVIHDNRGDRWEDTACWEHGGPGPQDDTGGGPGGTSDPIYSLDPSEGAAGDTFIASLTAEPPVDYASIVGVEFLGGDVLVCATQPRADELLLTLGVLDTAVPHPVDVVIDFQDATHLADDLFAIVGPGGGDGSGGDGSGGDGSGGDGSDGTGGGDGGDAGGGDGDGICGG